MKNEGLRPNSDIPPDMEGNTALDPAYARPAELSNKTAVIRAGFKPNKFISRRDLLVHQDNPGFWE